MHETHSKRALPRARWRARTTFLAGALFACALWYFLGRPEKTAAAFVPPSGVTAACWVRQPSTLTRLAQLGFADAEAWEVGAAQDGWLTATLAVSDEDGIEVRVPMQAGTTAYVWYRFQVARSGLVDYFDDLGGPPQHRATGEYGWIHPSDRWTFTLTVLFARSPETSDGLVSALGSRLKYASRINGPGPLRLMVGPRAYASVSCTPSGSLAIPADARVAGVMVGVLPQDAWVPLPIPMNSKPPLLREVEWATKDAAGARHTVGTWRLGLEFQADE